MPHYHTPIALGAPGSPETINTPLAGLDAALFGAYAQVAALTVGTGNVATLRVQNVRDYGAVGDGAANDTAAIAAAIAAASGGGTVFLPIGTYLINSRINLATNVHLVGAGPSSILQVGGLAHNAASVTGIGMIGINHASVENLRIIGPEDGTMTGANGPNAGHGILMDNAADCLISNVSVSRFNIQGILVGVSAACTRIRIQDCVVREIYSGNGISLDAASSDIIVSRPLLISIADCAIGLHNGCTRILIDSPLINTTNFGRGIDVYGTADGIAIEGGIIKSAASHGIYIFAPGVSGTPPTLNAPRITGVTIANAGADGIQLLGDGAMTTTSGVTLPNASITVVSTAGFPGAGTLAVGNQTVTYTSIDATHFLGCSGGSGVIAAGANVACIRDIYYANIANCTITNPTLMGLRIGRGVHNCQVTGNMITNSGQSGIRLEELANVGTPTGISIVGNTITFSGAYGVSATTNCTGRLVGNSLEGNTSGATSIPAGVKTTFQD